MSSVSRTAPASWLRSYGLARIQGVGADCRPIRLLRKPEVSSTLTEGQRVLPEATLAAGYVFRYTDIGPALANIAG